VGCRVARVGGSVARRRPDKARLSKTLVTLDTKVPLDVPLRDLVVRDSNAWRLIAFLKAMEFHSLIRRVVDATGVDPSGVEPDKALKVDVPRPIGQGRSGLMRII
jgi:5'-3' exonuclease